MMMMFLTFFLTICFSFCLGPTTQIGVVTQLYYLTLALTPSPPPLMSPKNTTAKYQSIATFQFMLMKDVKIKKLIKNFPYMFHQPTKKINDDFICVFDK